MTVEQAILELMKLGEKYGYENVLQFSGCYGATTQMLYFEDATVSKEFKHDNVLQKPVEVSVLNIPTDLCSG